MMKASKNFINNPLPNVATKTDYEAQAALTQQLVTAAQNGDKAALEQLCIFYEPLFRREMKREIFYKGLGYEEGLSLARLKFIELVLNYNGADFTHFAGYVRCRIHYALYDAMRKIWKEEENTAPLPAGDDADLPALADNIIEREELATKLKITPAMVTKHHKQALKNLRSNIA